MTLDEAIESEEELTVDFKTRGNHTEAERHQQLTEWLKELRELRKPIPMTIYCPMCKARHLDEGKFETHPHHTHSCQTCGHTWRPAVVHTVGVQFLPGFKNP